MIESDNIMAERLFNAQRRHDSLRLEGKHKQKFKRCFPILSHHETHESVMEQIMTPTWKSIKYSKKQLDSSILPPNVQNMHCQIL